MTTSITNNVSTYSRGPRLTQNGSIIIGPDSYVLLLFASKLFLLFL